MFQKKRVLRQPLLNRSLARDSKTKRVDCEEAVDRISNLPRNLIDLILERLPVDHAARTSILSKTWRNVLEMHPHLVFDEEFFSRMYFISDIEAQISQASRNISNILLSHSGPILRFHLSIPGSLPLHECVDIDFWIKNISKNGVRELELYCNKPLIANEIPSYLFSCSELTHLRLTNFILNPPLIFGGFFNLIIVELEDVIITSNISFGTRLKELVLKRCTGIQHLGCQFKYNNNLTNLMIVDCGKIDCRWFQCTEKVKTLALRAANSQNTFMGSHKLVGNMPLICSLHLDSFFLQRFESPTENLNNLFLYRVGFNSYVQIEGILSLIRSSPNLLYLFIEAVDREDFGETRDMQSWTEIWAGHYSQPPSLQVETVKIEGVVGSTHELEFIKFLLATSPSLRQMELSKNSTIDDPNEELRISRELMWFPRASAAAHILWT